MRHWTKKNAIEMVAEVWASIDGKLELFMAEKAMATDDPRRQAGGRYEGYLVDAAEMVKRLEDRGFVVVPDNWFGGGR